MNMNGETTLSKLPKTRKPEQVKRKTADTTINWDNVHKQILDGSAKLAWIDELSQEELEQAWARRAEQVARTLEEEIQGEQIELAVIRLGREIYGLDVRYVFDIRPLEHITRVPRVPEWVAGVVNLRGRVLSVLDLQRFLGLPRPESDGGEIPAVHHLIIAETPDMELALLADEVLSIETVPVNQIQEATSAVRGIRLEYLRGIVVLTNGTKQHTQNTLVSDIPSVMDNSHSTSQPDAASETLMVVLDLPALLTDKRLIVHEEIG